MEIRRHLNEYEVKNQMKTWKKMTYLEDTMDGDLYDNGVKIDNIWMKVDR